jgi:hypothetical protein
LSLEPLPDSLLRASFVSDPGREPAVDVCLDVEDRVDDPEYV